MIILGIDPGSRKAGFGLIEVKGRQINYLKSGVMRYDEEKEFIHRLGLIYKSCQDLLEKYSPDAVAFESLVYVKNVSSLAKLAQSRGAMLAAFGQTHKERLFEYSPNLVKSTVSGHGHATKEGVEKVLKMALGQRDFKSDDESDALAVALCHALSAGDENFSQKKSKLRQKSSGGLKSALAHKTNGVRE